MASSPVEFQRSDEPTAGGADDGGDLAPPGCCHPHADYVEVSTNNAAVKRRNLGCRNRSHRSARANVAFRGNRNSVFERCDEAAERCTISRRKATVTRRGAS